MHVWARKKHKTPLLNLNKLLQLLYLIKNTEIL